MPYNLRRQNARTVEALERIGEGVRRARRADHLSQRSLANLAGIDQGSVSRIENGVAPGMRIEYLARLVVVLDSITIGPSAERRRLEALLSIMEAGDEAADR